MNASGGAALCLDDYRRLARRRLPRVLFDYIDGVADDGESAARNRSAFAGQALVPRVFVDIAGRSTEVEAAGRRWSAPFGIAPMGASGLACLRGDLVLAAAAHAENIPFTLSASSMVPMEAVARVNPEAWYQVYLHGDRAIDDRLVDRVAQAGFRTLVVTADVAVGGRRRRDVANGFGGTAVRVSPSLVLGAFARPRWLLGTWLRGMLRDGSPAFENFTTRPVPLFAGDGAMSHRRDGLTWDDLARVRERWPHRLVVKGLLAAADVERAEAIGVDAAWLSNHGGRQLDGAVPAFVALATLATASGAPLFIDGGVRHGNDVLKARARGAQLCFVGRPFLYAAAVGGTTEVRRAIRLLREEIDRALALLGIDSPERIGPASLFEPDRPVTT